MPRCRQVSTHRAEEISRALTDAKEPEQAIEQLHEDYGLSDATISQITDNRQCSMTSEGSPYTIFRRALQRGSLPGVRAAVANLPGPPPLEDALVICLLLRDHEPDSYERAAVRWLGRLLLEQRGVSLRHAEQAAAYLAAWADPAR